MRLSFECDCTHSLRESTPTLLNRCLTLRSLGVESCDCASCMHARNVERRNASFSPRARQCVVNSKSLVSVRCLAVFRHLMTSSWCVLLPQAIVRNKIQGTAVNQKPSTDRTQRPTAIWSRASYSELRTRRFSSFFLVPLN